MKAGILVILSAILMAGCYPVPFAGQDQPTIPSLNGAGTMSNVSQSEKEKETEGMLPVNETNDGVLVEDLMDCADMIGKTVDEAGIPDNVIVKVVGSTEKTYADGMIFGSKDYAIIWIDSNYGNGPETVSNIWIHCKEVPYDNCLKGLSGLYGEPVFAGENPYVEADGGAVEFTEYETDRLKIRLSAASERDYAEIEIMPR